jgi:glycosyltransferase involved in cell wall biosynthesis
MKYRNLDIALLVPCYNEALSIEKVIKDFHSQLPSLSIVIFDNNSSDNTSEIAQHAGAEVVKVTLRGKGNVVRRMFADVDADVFVMVDGDATYDATAIKSLIDKLIDERLDMVVGCRDAGASSREAYRRGHQFGNWLLTGSVKRIFGGSFTDMLSGYRVFSKRFAKSFPALSQGFEIETELTVHALELRMPYGEITTSYGARPEGSLSKLSTYKDGLRILRTILRLFIAERSLFFYFGCSVLLAFTALILAIPVVSEYFVTGLVPRLPTAVLSASLMVCSLLALVCGLILDLVTRARHETKRLAYLSIPHPSHIASKN